jgi:maltose alpha-D-glucosyltransferase/alpha-amylase
MRHWFDAGLDGLRLDGIRGLVEREGLGRRNRSGVHTIVKDMREVIERDYPGRVLVAESNRSPHDVASYFGDGDECHMAFNASLMPGLMTALNEENRGPIVQTLRRTPDIPAPCQWALSLHNYNDVSLDLSATSEHDATYQTSAADPERWLNAGISQRMAPLFENDRRRIELGYALLFSLPCSPVIYSGNEIGMGDNVYLGDSAGVRTPMQWSSDRNGGFSSADPARLYAAANADPLYGYQALNVETQRRQPFSLLNWMRRLIALRKLHPVFGRGSIEFLEPRNHAVLAYARRRGDDRILVVANLSGKAQSVDLMLSLYAGVQPVELIGGASFRRIGAGAYSLALGPYGFYWFGLSRPAVRPARSNHVAAGVLSAGTDATETPAAEASHPQDRDRRGWLTE